MPYTHVLNIVVDSEKNRKTDFLALKTKDIYWILYNQHNKGVTPKCVQKWDNIYHFAPEEWPIIFSVPFVACNETALQSFQYKLIHRIIACRQWLYKLKIVDSPNCTKCGQVDTLQHFFINCQVLATFWQSFVTWWLNLSLFDIHLTEDIIIFGAPMPTNEAKLFNYTLIAAKKYIFDVKLCNKTPFFYIFLVHLKDRLENKKSYYRNKNNEKYFEDKWGALHECL